MFEWVWPIDMIPLDFLDVIVWTNDHMIEWVESIGLGSYAANLKDTGVHGAVLALDNDFDHEKLAVALKMPQVDTEVCTCMCAGFHTGVGKLRFPPLL